MTPRELDYYVGAEVVGLESRTIGFIGPHPMAQAADFDKFPHYSTDIAAAWKVVEHLSLMREDRAYKPAVRVTWYEHDGIARCEIAAVKFGFDDPDSVSVEEDGGEYPDEHMVPRVICLAALEFVRSHRRGKR